MTTPAAVPEPTNAPAKAPPGKIRTRRIVVGGILLFILVSLVIPVTHRVDSKFRVTPLSSEHIRAFTGGYLREVLVKAGDRVTAGQVIAVLEDDALLSSAEIARLQIAKLESDLAAASRPEQGAVRERLRLDLERARSHAESLNERIQSLVVRAGIDGIVLTEGLSDRVGDYIARGREIVHVLEPGTVRLDLKLEEADMIRVKREQVADIFFNALPGERFVGMVSSVVQIQDASAATAPAAGKGAKAAPARDFRAYIDIANPPARVSETLGADAAAILVDGGEGGTVDIGRFLPGMSGTAHIDVGSRSLAAHLWSRLRGMLRSDLLFF